MENVFVIKLKGGYMGSPQYWNGKIFQGDLKKAALYEQSDLDEEIQTMPAEREFEICEIGEHTLDYLTR
jgi:hypothetical protein